MKRQEIETNQYLWKYVNLLKLEVKMAEYFF